MKRIIKLTESDIRRIVERVINESEVKYNGISISPSKDGKGAVARLLPNNDSKSSSAVPTTTEDLYDF